MIPVSSPAKASKPTAARHSITKTPHNSAGRFNSCSQPRLGCESLVPQGNISMPTPRSGGSRQAHATGRYLPPSALGHSKVAAGPDVHSLAG